MKCTSRCHQQNGLPSKRKTDLLRADAHYEMEAASMQVVVEVYATFDLSTKPHLLLSLVLYKMVDPHSVRVPSYGHVWSNRRAGDCAIDRLY